GRQTVSVGPELWSNDSGGEAGADFRSVFPAGQRQSDAKRRRRARAGDRKGNRGTARGNDLGGELRRAGDVYCSALRGRKLSRRVLEACLNIAFGKMRRGVFYYGEKKLRNF